MPHASGKHEHGIRRANTIDLLDQQALRRYLEEVRLLNTVCVRLLLDGDEITPRTQQVIRPTYEAEAVRSQRRTPQAAVVCCDDLAVDEPEACAASPLRAPQQHVSQQREGEDQQLVHANEGTCSDMNWIVSTRVTITISSSNSNLVRWRFRILSE